MQVGTESYGLKFLEKLASFERGHDIDRGAARSSSMSNTWPTRSVALDRIAAYNEDESRPPGPCAIGWWSNGPKVFRGARVCLSHFQTYRTG